MGKKNIFIIVGIFLIALIVLVMAVDWTPQGNINLRDYYNITNVPYYNGTDINITGLYYGNGSQLTGITLTESDPFWTGNQSSYYLVSNPFGFYNSTDFSIADYYLLNNPFGFYNSTDFSISDYYLKNNPFGFYNSTDFSISDYYLKNNPFGFYNSTNPQTETDPLWTGNQSSYSTTATILGWSYYNSTDFSISDYYLKNNPFGFYNSTNPQTETDPLWTGNQSSYSTTSTIIGWGYYNSTDFSISDYYLKNNPFSFVNITTASDLNNLITLSQANITDEDWIEDSQEGDLNVNSSNSTTWWATVSGFVSKWFYKSGNDLALNETQLNTSIDARMVTTYYNATQSEAVVGTVDGGSLSDTHHLDGAYDGVTFNFSEESGSPGLDLRINFTGIPDFSRGVMRYKTGNLLGDYPIVQLWNYDDSAWEDYPVVGESQTFATMTQPVFDDSDHVTDGIVQMRIYKAGIGFAANHYYVDWIAISSGPGVPSGQEVDPHSIHTEAINDTQMNYTSGQLNIIQSWLEGLFISDSDLPLANKTTPHCDNVTGSDFDLCTNPDTTIGNCSGDQGCANVLYTTDEYIGGLSCADTLIAKWNDTSSAWYCADDETGEPGAGDIEGINTAGKYLTGGCATGTCSLLVNESELNITMDARDSDTTYTNGSGISLVGTEINHSDTSSQASDENSGNTFIQDIVLDTFGHITSIVNAAVDFSAYVAIADLVGLVGNWSADKSDYWNTSADLDTVISADEILEANINFTTACAAGSHYYLSGNDLACETDDDTTYTAGDNLDLTGTIFSLEPNVNITTLNVSDHFKITTINITCFNSACSWYTNATDSCMYWPSGGKDCGAA